MRLSQAPSRLHAAAHGFTLVEMLVVAPIAILSVAAIVSLTISMVGDAVIAQDRATVAYTTQDALDRMEQDIRLSSAFLSTFSALQPGQGRNATTSTMNDTTAFSSSPNGTTNDTLILNQTATTLDPLDKAREIVYYNRQPNDCAGANHILNRQLTTRVVYFLRNDGTGNNELWRRVIVPNWNTNTGGAINTSSVCSAPWQRDTCPAVNLPNCQTVDEKMVSNVSAFTLTYYTPSGASTTNSRAATNIKVDLAISRSIAGNTVLSSASLRATRTNDIVDAIPASPVVSIINPAVNTDNNPIKRTFGWNSVPFAAYYSVRYSVNGGPWVTETTTSTRFAVSGKPLDTIDIGVTSVNDMGQSSETLLNGTQIPLWTQANLQGNWACYDATETTYRCPAYTLLTSDVVVITGLAKNGSTTDPVFTLPQGIRPKKQLIFNSQVDGAPQGRVDIKLDGSVMYVGGGNSDLLSLDNIRFLRVGATLSSPWTTRTLANGWGNFGSDFGNLEIAKDTMGRTHINGVIVPGTTTFGTTTFNLLAGNQEKGISGSTSIFPGVTGGSSRYTFQTNATAAVTRGIGATFASYSVLFPSNTSTVSLTSIAPTGTWANSGGVNIPASRSKPSDNLVSLQGLIVPNNVTPGTVLFTLPAGSRPAKRLAFSAADAGGGTNSGQTTARIDILPNGNVIIQSKPQANQWLSLGGITFVAEQ